jgi:hypothetical protein
MNSVNVSAASPFLNRSYGIHRAAGVQRGPAARSVNSSPKQIRNQDEQTLDGLLYRYQGDDPDNHFNRWLRSAQLLDVPLVYFVGTRPNWYRPIYAARSAGFARCSCIDAAHIIEDAEEEGIRAVSNGLSFGSIHHRAFDEDLVGIDPRLRVHISRRLLDEEDGPVLDVLKGFHGTTIEAPLRRLWRPDPERFAVRFKRFKSAA